MSFAQPPHGSPSSDLISQWCDVLNALLFASALFIEAVGSTACWLVAVILDLAAGCVRLVSRFFPIVIATVLAGWLVTVLLLLANGGVRLVTRFFPVVLATLMVSACTDPEGARKALDANGYKEIVITGHRWSGCSENDTYKTGFSAIGVNGRPISGVVCRGAGFFPKGSTVRLD